MLKKILILRLSAIGDTIHTLPLVNALKQKYPECEIGWVVEDKAALFIREHQMVDKCFIVPKIEWKKRGFCFKNILDFFKITKQINDENYEVVIDTQQLLKSAIFLPFLNIKRKITLSGGREFSGIFSNEIVRSRHKLFDPNYHVVRRNMELAEYLGADTNNIEFKLSLPNVNTIKRVESLLSSLDTTKKTVAISPATTWDNKHWNEENWKTVLKYLDGKVNIVFTGTAQDIPLIKRISSGICEYSVLAGQTNLEELAEVYRHSDVLISPDSGSAHIGWAVENPFVITVFTATAANRNAPFGEKCLAFSPELSCYPCMKRKCKRKDEKNLCCRSVEAEKIVNILKNILHSD